jgi:hypothetical protein
MHCPSCDLSWEVRARPDGSLPQMARCPKALGGCGAQRRVPRSGHVNEVPAVPDEDGWEPTGQPGAARQVAEQCPDCDERGEATGRQIKTQRETDLEALDLAGRKGVMLGQLRDLAESDRLDDASRLKIEWFSDAVKAACTAARLDDLADLWAQARIQPRRWRQPRPAVLDAADDCEDDYADRRQDDRDPFGSSVVSGTDFAPDSYHPQASYLRRRNVATEGVTEP